MDCVICASIPQFLRPPRNTMCGACFEGAKNLLNTVSTLEKRLEENDNTNYCFLGGSDFKPDSNKTLMSIWRFVSTLIDATDELNEQRNFLTTGSKIALKDQIHPDIFVKPGNNGPSIPAHKAVLATRSEVFKSMLDSDSCKTPVNDTVTLSELSYEELESLLEFLYSGILAEEKIEKHVYALSLAADKYNIPYMQKICEHHMLDSLSMSNALEILEVSHVCSYQKLKTRVLKFIVKNMQEIVFSPAYYAFALKNPHLGIEVTRASLNKDATPLSEVA